MMRISPSIATLTVSSLIFTKIFAISEKLVPDDHRLSKLIKVVTLERCLATAAVVLAGGLALLLFAISNWKANSFGNLDYSKTMRIVIPGVTFAALGFQTILSSFFISVLGMKHR